MTTISSPIDLLSAIPFLIGYQPDDSIVLLALENDSISLAIRIDFPENLSDSEANSLVARLAEHQDVLLKYSEIIGLGQPYKWLQIMTLIC